MADYQKALALVLKHEGGYVNDPLDRGGETYRGVARRFHPDWSGWKRIDGLQGKSGFPDTLNSDTKLQQSLAAFYRKNYWSPIQGDKLGDDALAQELFDTAVNMGVRRASRFLQEALNLLNRNQSSYDDLAVDGWLGDKSLTALQALIKADKGTRYLLKLLNALQAAHYIEIMRKDPTQERFARGWLNRA